MLVLWCTARMSLPVVTSAHVGQVPATRRPDYDVHVYADEEYAVNVCCNVVRAVPIMQVLTPIVEAEAFEMMAACALLDIAKPVEDLEAIKKDRSVNQEDSEIPSEAQITWECAICLGDLKRPMQLPCRHIYCRNCLDDYDRMLF